MRIIHRLAAHCLGLLLATQGNAASIIPHAELSSEQNSTISGGSGALMPDDATGQRLEFEFESADYFSPKNIGHLTIGIRGESIAVGGRGIVMGNLTQYGFPGGRCQQTNQNNVAAIESYWPDNNCVYGGETQSAQLRNGERYKVRVESLRNGLIRYYLYLREDEDWRLITSAGVHDDFNDKVQANLAGWWIAEVFGTHQWRVDFYDIRHGDIY
ncbi:MULTISPECIES: hypothetical protein [unclassified Pseudomonas]|uniref:hypothetical protein n=1 Tax=unclassified Pseudomonas TaxID=196821 RepID=UPI00244A39B6|nr:MULTISPECIES: hypothetical protein [unclassified Pseudomonas]MDH0896641.1 hypothetical protein [Pseudomonas sp. GD03875]MDH1066418.1 hypothetical protein [Pseudomonas sp. GD03985]